VPNSLLERRATNVERQVETLLRGFDEADNTSNQRFVFPVGPDQVCLREAILQLVNEFIGIAPQQDCGDPFST
jgi:hypothetical protein